MQVTWRGRTNPAQGVMGSVSAALSTRKTEMLCMRCVQGKAPLAAVGGRGWDLHRDLQLLRAGRKGLEAHLVGDSGRKGTAVCSPREKLWFFSEDDEIKAL